MLDASNQTPGSLNKTLIGGSKPDVNALPPKFMEQTHKLKELVRMLDEGFIQVDPDAQREYAWTRDQVSKIVWYVLQGLPLPAFWFLADKKHLMKLIDGLQRLSSFCDFITDSSDDPMRISLEGDPLHGLAFRDLSEIQKHKLMEAPCKAIILAADTPDLIRSRVMEGLNNGTPLTSQQMRNMRCLGDGTKFVRKLVEAKRSETDKTSIVRAAGRFLPSKIQDMDDREMVVQFMSLQPQLGNKELCTRSLYQAWLDGGINMFDALTPDERESLEAQFFKGLDNCKKIFGDNALMYENGRTAHRTIGGLQIAAMARYNEDYVLSNKEALAKRFWAAVDSVKPGKNVGIWLSADILEAFLRTA